MDAIALSLRSLLLLRRSRRSIRQEELLDARSIIILVALMEAQLMPQTASVHSRIADLIIGITGKLIECLQLDRCSFSVRRLDPK